MNATIKVSHKKLPMQAVRNTAVFLADFGLTGEITRNTSVVDGEIENGLEVTIFDAHYDNILGLWEYLEHAYRFKCAWLRIEHRQANKLDPGISSPGVTWLVDYDGCIKDWL